MSTIQDHQKQHAFLLFFPATSIYAALVVPLSVFAMTSGTAWPPALIGLGHAREMLFGFALALVAGYTLGPLSQRSLLILFMLWLGARLVYLVFPQTLFAEILNGAFVLALAVYIVPKFKAAKKWRNRILSPLLLSLCLVPVIYSYITHNTNFTAARILLLQAVLLFALLMAFVGGRIIAAAAAGESERRGLKLESRVQPKLEAALILSLLAAVSLMIFAVTYIAAFFCGLAGIALLVRLGRWRLWRCSHRFDLLGLGIGYAWLATGLIALAISMLTQTYIVQALHIITIGALGSLSTGVMARLYYQQQRRQTPAFIALTTTVLIAVATLSRVAAGIIQSDQVLLLWIAAGCWSTAYLLLGFLLLPKLSSAFVSAG
jgi:uncharacterized protein involved in response to NO